MIPAHPDQEPHIIAGRIAAHALVAERTVEREPHRLPQRVDAPPILDLRTNHERATVLMVSTLAQRIGRAERDEAGIQDSTTGCIVPIAASTSSLV